MTATAPRLLHFSEDGDIERFHPRVVTVPSARQAGQEWLNGPLVWAVDERRQATYLFPRECPRIVLWPTDATTATDLDAWWHGAAWTMVAYVERAWVDRIRSQTLYRYELPSGSFRPTPDPWMWVAEHEVAPRSVDRIDDLPGALGTLGVELRVTEDLLWLRGVWGTTLHASGIRLRNAKGWPD